MRAGERASAQTCIVVQGRLFHEFCDTAETTVLELPHIELSTGRLILGPAQEDVARSLKHALPLDHPLTLMARMDELR